MIHPLAQEQQQQHSSSFSHHHSNDEEANNNDENYSAGTPLPPVSSSNTASTSTTTTTTIAADMSEKLNSDQPTSHSHQQQQQQQRPTNDAYYDHHYYQQQHHHQQQQQQQQFYAPHSPELPFPSINQYQQQQPLPQQRAYSVTAMPSELQQAVLRHQQQLAEQRQQQLLSTPNQPWWQYYYQLYHYHPPAGRKPTVFGPYLLLQTLGEGEFGKVKLGIHIETGQEVAIKLIKKDNIDSSTRMSKVEREISVLRKVRHPYIVKLYDVIETERYIGIILQYASGGELFEYILAHRYLKEKDASRLFAQLISGVHYMHQKHIVHRDLKLENLLLDRNRCIIITDFGFANQFASARDDLMSTSCGSPCYAAPELVISEGLYVGSAVDIWSCGVILYAMLCGYLPFDDDPANPDGDNINLLYKYILNTELAFPDYVSSDARDLLRKMLVPDPAKRCTMQTIMGHPWLRPHRILFEKSLGDLELDAMVSAELPLPPTTPVVPTADHRQRQQEQQEPTPPPQEELQVPKSEKLSKESTLLSPNEQMDDQMVPQEDEEDKMDIDSPVTVPDVYSPSSTPKPIVKDINNNNSTEEQDRQQKHEVEHQKGENSDESKKVNQIVGQMESTEQQLEKEEEKPTPLAQVDTASRDISSMELPASIHTESMSTTTAEDKEILDVNNTTTAPTVVESPQPTRTTSKKVHQRGTEMIKNLLSGTKSSSSSRPNSMSMNNSSNNNNNSRRPFSMQPEPAQRSTPQPGNSILHAKFLSSVQKQNDVVAAAAAAAAAGSNSTLATTTPSHYRLSNTNESPLASMSTPNGMMVTEKPLPQRPKESSRTSMYQPRPVPPPTTTVSTTTSTSSRGTRRKALSLLVNPMTNQDGDRRTISFTTRRPASRQQQSAAVRQQQQQQHPSSPRPDAKLVVSKDEPRPQSTVSMTPSASEQSITRLPPSPTSPDTMSREYKHKSAGKKLMDWFKKKPLSTKDNNNRLHADMMMNSGGASNLNKPLGSYAVDFKDAKLRTYHGAVDQNALTSRSPQEVLVEVKQTLISMGIDVKDDGEFKLKCVRRRRRSLQQQQTTQQHQRRQHQPMNSPSPSPSSQLNDIHKKRRMTPTGPRFRNLLRRASNTGENVVIDEDRPALPNNNNSNGSGNEHSSGSSIIYGDPVVDPGEEVRFSMELCKIKNLPGLYIVDIRRMRGNVWSYKFLYHAMLGVLDLGGKGGGYMSTRAPSTTATTTAAAAANSNNEKLLRPPQQSHNITEKGQQEDDKLQRISMASSSNNSSCVMDDTAIPEEKTTETMS